jgi:hypothetical protein
MSGVVDVPPGGIRFMALDFETVRFLRVVFAVIFAVVGGAAGVKYGEPLVGEIGGLAGPAVGAVIGAIFGWNIVDLIKGRATK